jgi:hypothetical protein
MPDAREIDGHESSQAEIDQQVARESERRARLGVPAAAGGVLYLLSGIILTSTLKGIPTVGLLQGVAPALRGEANPTVSPRAAEVQFQSHHSFGLIAGSVLVAMAYAALVLVLLFVLEATRFRRPQTNSAARPLILVGGVVVAVLNVITQIFLAIKTHDFATGGDFSNHAVEAVSHNSAFVAMAYLTPLAGICLTAGIIMAMLNSVRVGLLPRWVGMVGGVAAVLLLLPTETLDVIVAFWMVAMGILLMGRWPNGDPPAWASGVARPWPSQAELRAQQAEEKEGKAKRGEGKAKNGRSSKSRGADKSSAQPRLPAASSGDAPVNGDVAPEPAQPAAAGSTRKRRRKRSSKR